MIAKLLHIDIYRDVNDDGDRVFFVTPLYRRDGKLMTVPDSRGWPTLKEAVEHAERVAGGKIEPLV